MPVLAAIPAIIGAATSVVGLVNSAKAKKEAEENAKKRPQYGISPEVGKTLSLTESELANGMSARAERAYTDANDRQFSGSLSALLKSGGDPNNIGDIYDSSESGKLKLSALQDELRLKQIQNVIAARMNKQQEQQTGFTVNQFAPWQDRTAATGQARGGAQKQIWEGVNTFGSAAMQYGQQRHEEKMLDQYLNSGV